MNRVQLGLCCLNTELRERRIFCSRTCTRANFTVEKAKALALQNIEDISKMCEWNYDHNIFVFRLSSDLFPHYNDEEVESYDMEFAREALKKAGETARRCRQRINFHPGQYNQIGAKEEDVFRKTCQDLEMHSDILDMMEIDKNGILCIHGGGVYGDKAKTIERWVEQFQLLSEKVKRRLCIENCERCYSVEDCLVISERCGIPIIFDSHHFDCYNLLNRKKDPIDIDAVLPRVLEGWRRRDMIPLFHISEQREGDRVGAHSDFIETIPAYMLTIPEKYGMSVDIEVEAKMKEQAIMGLYAKYPHLNQPLSS